ncbi:LysR family transcriptional regulator [Acetobacter sp. AN02]|uniref:winged helix-turn-helix domain-containing protein n=1 Tax=Acetobacter sp. AN02 TaxID=2894186 RepID=UPI0024346715|nr:LysR family transcriptional regulator [Acetobacter sp. AN02]MDG6093870.1 LysR family transcriptional regulator [Acetobacter sp. AN02]
MADSLRLTLRIDIDGRPALGHGKIILLEHIDATGSISAAGRAMGMSYRRAWLLVESVNALFSEPLVGTRPGGGGGAFLTETGHTIVRLYREAELLATRGSSSALEGLAKKIARPEKNTSP